VDPESFTDKASLQPGDLLVVTGALGAGILAAAIREQYPGSEEREKILSANGTRLDAAAGAVIRRLGLKAAASLTGFGLGGRLLEMLEASDLAASIHAGSITLLPQTRELATQGFSPGNGRAGPSPGHRDCRIAPGIDPVLTDSIFDAQAAGGVILAVPPDTIATALALLAEGGETAQAIGEVVPHRQGLPRLNILA
jgi:selenide,water dikinase